ncbi:cell filamentation protein Fic [Alcanivorax sp. N3-2A]|nr:cell filamentation protein Fic [Alcanivorax sp. N3-2A]|tara:strand:+ start:25079 stop:26467 length:1389 start_codon:yes stop_codon:yes gene_type:complete
MAEISQPPDLKRILEENQPAVLAEIERHGAVDAKGRYLHWHDLRRRLPASHDKEVVWAAIKLARRNLLKPLSLSTAGGQPFQFCVTDMAESVLHQIDRLCAPALQGAEAGLSSPGEREQYLVETLMMEEAISSAQLEGAATTRKVAREMLVRERRPRNEDERMIFNSYQLMREARRARDEPLSLDLIFRFHELATASTDRVGVIPGEPRQGDDVVVVDRDGDVVHQPPDAERIPARLDALCGFANYNHDGRDGRTFIHPAAKAVILHFMLGYEHPFVDGNGRTARALFYWYMLKAGYWTFEYISISSLLKTAPIQYGQAYLFTETDDADLTYFIAYQLGVVRRAIDDFLEYVKVKHKEYLELLAWLADMGLGSQLNYRQGSLLRQALKKPGSSFTAKQLKNLFDVSENTARADLRRLEKLQVLAPYRVGKTVEYVARADAAERLRAGFNGANRRRATKVRRR